MSVRPEPAPERSARVSVPGFVAKARRGERLAMLTAYDYTTARLVDAAGVDAILVGDSLAMVMLGHENTLSVTLDEMLHHARAVARGARRALLIGDLPFGTYQADASDAVRAASRFVAEAGMAAVKLEGGQEFADTVRAIVRAGIPVQGHIGLTPQRLNVLGGFRVQGRTGEQASRLVDDALALEEAGCFSIVLEGVPSRLGAHITGELDIPTIGIGAGPGTAGQVLVAHDLLGLFEDLQPRFVRRYAELAGSVRQAVASYRDDVAAGRFPGPENSFAMPDAEWEAFLELRGVRGRFGHGSC